MPFLLWTSAHALGLLSPQYIAGHRLCHLSSWSFVAVCPGRSHLPGSCSSFLKTKAGSGAGFILSTTEIGRPLGIQSLLLSPSLFCALTSLSHSGNAKRVSKGTSLGSHCVAENPIT